MANRVRSRGWCLTINNPEESDRPVFDEAKHTYIVYQFEYGDTEETLHIQGYVYYTHPQTFNRVKRDYPRAHIEKARGTADHNRAYCTKVRTVGDTK